MRILRLGVALIFVSIFSGCAAVAITGGSLGLGYSVTNVAKKTINHPLDRVVGAVMDASNKMEIRVIENWGNEEGRTIKATTKSLSIYIELESITPKTTKMTINAKEGLFFKDKSTANAIILEAEKFLVKEPGVRVAAYP
ncbi:MAG: DUF3568 family protein [Nitrospinota bacterium]